jgi:hypothetical protein
MKLSKYLILSLFIITSLSACSKVDKQQEGITVMDYNNPKKVCFGRIEMMVPKETEIKYSDFNYNGSDLEVDESVNTYDDYKKLVNDKIQSLKNEPHETESALLSYEMTGPVKQGDRSLSHIIVYRPTEFTKSAYKMYGYLYLGPKKLILLKSFADNNLVNEAVADMQHTLKSIKIKSANETLAGLCWKDFYILDDMSQNRPFVGGNLYFRFPSYPRVSIGIEHRMRLESDRPLINMVRENEHNAPLLFKTIMSSTNLREDKKEINGLAGEEVFSHTKRRGYFERGFENGVWQYLGSLDNHNDPLVHYSIESAEIVHDDEALESTISQKMAIKLYDFILNSLQISPNNKKDQ